jgi:hypothetical protein
MTPEQFVNLIHGPEAVIHFQVGSRTWKNKPQTFCQAEHKLHWRNSLGDGICFVVNTGGTRDDQITRVNALFVDWDTGRDQQKRYFTEDVVRPKKAQFLHHLRRFPVRPSIVVETRNGFHAYWLVSGATVEMFRNAQKQLAQLLGADQTVCNPARVMRLPGFDWTKRGYAAFPVRVITHRNVRYSVEEILGVLPPQQPSRETANEEGRGRIGTHNKCSTINTRALIVGAKPDTEALFASMAEAISHLKQQDLAQYLGLGIGLGGDEMVVNCPFHADGSPSASVFRSRSTGHWCFHCHSSNCGVKGSIIDLAMRILGTTDMAVALRHLMAHYNLKIETGWKSQQQAVLDCNIAVMRDEEMLPKLYPGLYRLIRRVREDLISKLEVAKRLIRSERNQHDGQLVFYASLRWFHKIAKRLDHDPRQLNRQNQKVDRYCLLGLMRKLPDGEVPPRLLEQARQHQARRKTSNHVQFYSIAAYTEEVLRQAEDRAQIIIHAGLSVTGISPSSIVSLFGADLARQVYPQVRDLQGSRTTQAFSALVERLLLEALITQGYTTVTELRSALSGHYDWKAVTARRIQRCLPELFTRNGLVKVCCNAKMKRRWGIRGAGYPWIIVRSTDLSAVA